MKKSNYASPAELAIAEAGGDPWLALRLAVIYQAHKDVEAPWVLSRIPRDETRRAAKRQIVEDAEAFLSELRSAFSAVSQS